MPEHPTDAHFSFTFVFKQALNDDLRKKLNKGGYTFFYNESDGGHTWSNWRKYLIDYLPRLFKN